MKTFPALYIDPNGKLRAIPECPEEPKSCRYSALCHMGCECMQKHEQWERALAAAKQSAIEVSDLEQAKQLIERMVYERDPNAILVYQIEGYRDTVIPLPTGWKVDMKEAFEKNEAYGSPENQNRDNPIIGYRKQLAILISPKSEQQPETDETLALRDYSRFKNSKLFKKNHIPDAGEKVESQEELWNDAESVVSDELTRYYSDLPSDQLAFNIAEALKEKYLLTRKP